MFPVPSVPIGTRSVAQEPFNQTLPTNYGFNNANNPMSGGTYNPAAVLSGGNAMVNQTDASVMQWQSRLAPDTPGLNEGILRDGIGYHDVFVGATQLATEVSIAVMTQEQDRIQSYLPLKYTDKPDVVWYHIDFADHLMDPNSEGGNPRNTQFMIGHEHESLRWVNKGIRATKKSFFTQQGQYLWAGMCIQLMNAARFTLRIAILNKIYHSNEFQYAKKAFRDLSIKEEAAGVYQRASPGLHLWDIYHQKDGVENLMQAMGSQWDSQNPGKGYNRILVPKEARTEVARSTYNQFLLTGLSDNQVPSMDQTIKQELGGLQIHLSVNIPQGDQQPALDACQRVTSIGTFVDMNDESCEDLKWDEYQTKCRDRKFLDESDGDGVQKVVKIETAVRYSYLYTNLEKYTDHRLTGKHPTITDLGRAVVGVGINTWFDLLNAVSRLDVVLRHFIAKPEAFAALLEMAAIPFVSEATPTRGELSSIVSGRYTRPQTIKQARRNGHSSVTQGRSRAIGQRDGDDYEDDPDEDADMDDDDETYYKKVTQWSKDYSQAAVGKIAAFFNGTDKKHKTHINKKIYTHITSARFKESPDVGAQVWRLGTDGLLIGAYKDAVRIQKQYNKGSHDTTPFERISWERGVPGKDRLDAANADSPFVELSPNSEAFEPKLLYDPFKHSTLNLPYPTMLITLCSSHIILLDLSEDDLNILQSRENKGVVTVLPLTESWRASKRRQAVQYSMSVSAVYAVARFNANSINMNEDDESFARRQAALITKLIETVGTQFLSSDGERKVLRRPSAKFSTVSRLQFPYKQCILECSEIVDILIRAGDRDLSEDDLKEIWGKLRIIQPEQTIVQARFLHPMRTYSDEEETVDDDDDDAMVGSRAGQMRLAQFKDGSARDLIKQFLDKSTDDSVLLQASRLTAELSKICADERKAAGATLANKRFFNPDANSFGQFSDWYIALYILYTKKEKGTGVPSVEWTKDVKIVDAIFCQNFLLRTGDDVPGPTVAYVYLSSLFNANPLSATLQTRESMKLFSLNANEFNQGAAPVILIIKQLLKNETEQRRKLKEYTEKDFAADVIPIPAAFLKKSTVSTVVDREVTDSEYNAFRQGLKAIKYTPDAELPTTDAQATALYAGIPSGLRTYAFILANMNYDAFNGAPVDIPANGTDVLETGVIDALEKEGVDYSFVTHEGVDSQVRRLKKAVPDATAAAVVQAVDPAADRSKERLIGILSNLPIKDGRLLLLLLNNDIPIPFAFLLCTPWAQYTTAATALLDITGLGNTYWNGVNWEVVQDIMPGQMQGRLEVLFEPIITNPKAIVVAWDTLVTGYVGGNSHRFWEWSGPSLNLLNGNHLTTCSIFVKPYLVNQRVTTSVLDITGTFDPSLNPSQEDVKNTSFPCDKVFNDMWKLTPQPLKQTETKNANNYTIRMRNTILLRTQYYVWNSDTKQFDVKIASNAHFRKIFDGCCAARNLRTNQTDDQYKTVITV